MDLSGGFQIEDPDVFVPWGIEESQLLDLLPMQPHHVTNGYYVIDCVSLSGLDHALGFHFRPKPGGQLVELEFFRRTYSGVREDFDGFQDHLVATFGPPSSQSPGSLGPPRYVWKLGKATLQHYVFNRFGPEEHVRITRGPEIRSVKVDPDQ